ncbi:MAG: cell division protein ZipA C-terminal FtsZ-binding domain-containing protein [Burkholderiaceae bacterium]
MSNSLQVGLAVAGGVVLAAVVAYNAWKTQKSAPKLPEAEPADTADSAAAPASGADSRRAERQEPQLDWPGPAAGPPMLPAMEKKPALDALIDVLAPIALESVASGELALSAMPPTRRVGSKPFAVEGHNAATQHWEWPQPGQRYQAFQAGVQLANRTGALNEIEYSEFVVKTREFADAVGGEPDFPDMLAEVARGRELDEFASQHDAQISFTLRAVQAAWSPGYVQQHAARLGFVPGVVGGVGAGRLVLPASTSGGAPVLSLTFDPRVALADDPLQSALHEITLSLDAPQVNRAERPFVRMRECALALAARMEGAIVDDNGQPISADGLDSIGASLEQLYDVLDARDLSAGSALARRLFS